MAVLDERLEVVRKARGWSGGVIEELGAFTRGADERELVRIDPVSWGERHGIGTEEAIDLFLHAAKARLYRMDWQLFCPSCAGVIDSFNALRGVNPHFKCLLCQLETEATLDDYIAVTFTVDPEVRAIRFHDPDALDIEELYLRFHFLPIGRMGEGGPKLVDVLPGLLGMKAWVEPGTTARFEATVPPDCFLLGHDLRTGAGFMGLVTEAGSSELRLSFRDGRFDLGTVSGTGEVREGPLEVEVRNDGASRCAFAVFFMPAAMLAKKMTLTLDPYLSAKRLLTNQTFRDLFEDEALGATEGIGAKDMCFLFTDLKGSTEMYDRVGDLKAFSLVRLHFGYLIDAVRRNHGAVVKTIGDAVMASFVSPVDAVRAALEMREAMRRFNETVGKPDMAIKIGAHRGPCIAVTMNGRLDFFGQTVNVAARVQGLAGADEVYVTRDLVEASGVRDLLGSRPLGEEIASLKGVQEGVRVYRIGA
jgi:class 3 adenylate cyclase